MTGSWRRVDWFRRNSRDAKRKRIWTARGDYSSFDERFIAWILSAPSKPRSHTREASCGVTAGRFPCRSEFMKLVEVSAGVPLGKIPYHQSTSCPSTRINGQHGEHQIRVDGRQADSLRVRDGCVRCCPFMVKASSSLVTLTKGWTEGWTGLGVWAKPPNSHPYLDSNSQNTSKSQTGHKIFFSSKLKCFRIYWFGFGRPFGQWKTNPVRKRAKQKRPVRLVRHIYFCVLLGELPPVRPLCFLWVHWWKGKKQFLQWMFWFLGPPSAGAIMKYWWCPPRGQVRLTNNSVAIDLQEMWPCVQTGSVLWNLQRRKLHIDELEMRLIRSQCFSHHCYWKPLKISTW